jgi:glycosyltransferase involved in cell wall biosynthesis
MAFQEEISQQPTISVIIPCYMQAQFLHDSLNSVLVQSYSNWECIIVNDGSPDSTEEVALQYCNKDNRFKYIKKINGGLSSARNAGIKIAIGKYILPLDADDIIGTEYLQKAVQHFIDNDNVKLVYCEAERFGADNGFWGLAPYAYKNLLLENMIFCSAFFRKKDWDAVGGYDESFVNGLEDWDFWLKLLDKESIVVKIPKVLFFYRINEQSMLRSINKEDGLKIKWKIFLKHIEKYKAEFDLPLVAYADQIYLTEKNMELKNHISNLQKSKSFLIGNKIVRAFNYFKK